MSRLPPHHVSRARLTDACSGQDGVVVVVEAAAGYGKSVLAAELVEVWGSVPVEVLLEEGGVSAELLAARLRAAVSRAGFLDAAASMAAAGADPAGAVDAMVAGLKGEACAIVIDDAHHANRDAGALIDRIASLVAPPQRLVVLVRRLPPGRSDCGARRWCNWVRSSSRCGPRRRSSSPRPASVSASPLRTDGCSMR
jgi:ATP/maltotriose-dependent transcriptional regulator MalT